MPRNVKNVIEKRDAITSYTLCGHKQIKYEGANFEFGIRVHPSRVVLRHDELFLKIFLRFFKMYVFWEISSSKR